MFCGKAFPEHAALHLFWALPLTKMSFQFVCHVDS